MSKKMNRKLIVVCMLVFLLVGTDRAVQASAGIDAVNVKTVIEPRNTNINTVLFPCHYRMVLPNAVLQLPAILQIQAMFPFICICKSIPATAGLMWQAGLIQQMTIHSVCMRLHRYPVGGIG